MPLWTQAFPRPHEFFLGVPWSEDVRDHNAEVNCAEGMIVLSCSFVFVSSVVCVEWKAGLFAVLCV